jgi:hypothetical protein
MDLVNYCGLYFLLSYFIKDSGQLIMAWDETVYFMDLSVIDMKVTNSALVHSKTCYGQCPCEEGNEFRKNVGNFTSN